MNDTRFSLTHTHQEDNVTLPLGFEPLFNQHLLPPTFQREHKENGINFFLGSNLNHFFVQNILNPYRANLGKKVNTIFCTGSILYLVF